MTVASKHARTLSMSMRPGFTVFELLIVLMIGGVLASLAAPPISAYWNSREMMEARDALIMIAAEARAQAVEDGDLVLMDVSSATDSVVVRQRNGTVVQILDLQSGELHTDMVGADLTICYMPRGYAHPDCRDGDDLPKLVGFTAGADTVWAEITLGQVERK